MVSSGGSSNYAPPTLPVPTDAPISGPGQSAFRPSYISFLPDSGMASGLTPEMIAAITSRAPPPAFQQQAAPPPAMAAALSQRLQQRGQPPPAQPPAPRRGGWGGMT